MLLSCHFCEQFLYTYSIKAKHKKCIQNKVGLVQLSVLTLRLMYVASPRIMLLCLEADSSIARDCNVKKRLKIRKGIFFACRVSPR